MKLYLIKLLCLTIISILMISSVSANSLKHEISEEPIKLDEIDHNKLIETTATDLDPLVDTIVTVKILKIRSFEKRDVQTGNIEKIDLFNDPDFYVKVYINGVEFISPTWRNNKYIENVDWSAELNVPDDEEVVKIRIELWDWNLGLKKPCDVSCMNYNSGDNYRQSFGADLEYSIMTGHWWGDDFTKGYSLQDADPSGYGRLNGCDDGSIYQPENDCELWFDIYQNDYDNDNIPYWTEVNIYNTNPEESDLGTDIDQDGIPIEWEHKWGHYVWYNWHQKKNEHSWIYSPIEWNDHANMDIDLDGLDNIEEYLTSQWFSDPFRKDLFLEIDQMEIGPNGEGSTIPKLTKDLLIIAHNRHNIVLHIDDGCMGGGQTNIPFDLDSTRQELDNIYYNYFLNGDENYWRKGVFHYGLVVYHASYPGFVFRSDSFQVSTRAHDKIPRRYPIINRLMWEEMDMDEIRATVYAGAMMHENGHTLGIYHDNTPGCDDQEGKWPWQKNYWKWTPYISVMNYRYVYKMVDYSDGSRGRNDFDDWNRLDLTRFQNNWI
jgi:hypothetical protein